MVPCLLGSTARRQTAALDGNGNLNIAATASDNSIIASIALTADSIIVKIN